MKGDYTPLDQLTDKSKNFKIKAKVTEKGRAIQSPNKKRHQSLILEDDKGNRMRGALFEQDIESYDEALERGKEYEISNAIIKEVSDNWKSNPKDREYRISFNDKVKLVPLTTNTSQMVPHYHSIISIPRNSTRNDLIDVLGVLIFVDELKTIPLADNKETQVLELLITDHSSEHPLQVTLWNDLPKPVAEQLKSWAENILIVASLLCESLSVKVDICFSLNSSMSTEVIVNPDIKEAHALRDWVMQNNPLVNDRQSKAVVIRTEPKQRHITTLAGINAKKAHNTWQDESFWIAPFIPNAALSDLHQYIGCSKCGRKAEVSKNNKFNCAFCKTSNANAEQRINFSFIADDETGKYKFTIFNDNVESLFAMKAEELAALKNNDETPQAIEKIDEIKTKKLYLNIGPAKVLSASKILNWTVRSMALE